METICHTTGAAVTPSLPAAIKQKGTEIATHLLLSGHWILCIWLIGKNQRFYSSPAHTGLNRGQLTYYTTLNTNPLLGPFWLSLQATAISMGPTSGGRGLHQKCPKQGQSEYMHMHLESTRLELSLASQTPSNANPGPALQAASLS